MKAETCLHSMIEAAAPQTERVQLRDACSLSPGAKDMTLPPCGVVAISSAKDSLMLNSNVGLKASASCPARFQFETEPGLTCSTEAFRYGL